jgi:hypothetical protein
MILPHSSVKYDETLSSALPMAPSPTLAALERRSRKLLDEVRQIGPVLKGSVSASYTRCGQRNCACQNDPAKLHGPYWQWSTAVHGKTVSRRLNDDERTLYEQWIANRKRLEHIIQSLHSLALDAAAELRKERSTQ